jgi:para-aminobenzoate synthetase component I
MNMTKAREYMNLLGSQQRGFLFIIDFELKNSMVYPLDEMPPSIQIVTPEYQKTTASSKHPDRKFSFKKNPISFKKYKEVFDNVMAEIQYGNSFLLNLCFPAPIQTDLSLEEIFLRAKSKYKLLVEDQFVVFSPECFVKIKDKKIYSYPMKGTIDADIENAEKIILGDEKELAEHFTIVDLIRNDLSMVGTDTWVRKFRFVEQIHTNSKNLLQVSSEIEATLPHDYYKKIGDIIFTLLPAGSISGAPKRKTLEIIKNSESMPRGYYTGICGVFDGNNLDSFVLIRYIEKTENGMVFRSGGGITYLSDAESEYREIIDKIYVPFN